ncbi:MAG: hypothetical protein LIP16_02550 [Clostridium sp.]|nr:hypothetical protein [Clostridium sp.]
MPTPKFKNLKLGAKEEAEFRESDVTTDLPEESKEYVNYPGSTISELNKKLNEPGTKKFFNVKFIPRNKIVFNPNNRIPITPGYVKELADSILEQGLISSLSGLYDEEEDIYRLDAGHARIMAIDSLIEKYKDYPTDCKDLDYLLYKENVEGLLLEGIPLNVKKKKYAGTELEELDEIKSELRLLDDNKYREPSPSLKIELVARRAELIEKQNHLLSRKERVNVNKAVAGQMNMTERQVQKYRSIDRGLIPELKELFGEGKITVSDGDIWSKLTEEEQREGILPVVQSLIDVGVKATNEAVDKEKIKQQELQAKLEQEMAARNDVETQLELKMQAIRQLEDSIKESQEKQKDVLCSLRQKADSEKRELLNELERAKASNSAEHIQELERKLKEAESSLQGEINKEQEKYKKMLEDRDKNLKQLQDTIRQIQNTAVNQGEEIERAIKSRLEAETKIKIAIKQLDSTFALITDAFSTLSPATQTVAQKELKNKTSRFLATIK